MNEGVAEKDAMRGPVIPEFDAETYLLWESRQQQRFELHDGFLIAFAGGTLDHSQLALNLQNILQRLFAPPCRTFGSDIKVQIDAKTFYYADAGIVCEPIVGSATLVTRPHVVAEVLSPSTRAYDIIEKRARYRSLEGLHAYLIVHTTLRKLEIDLRTSNAMWQTFAVDVGEFPLGSGSISLDELYSQTSIGGGLPS